MIKNFTLAAAFILLVLANSTFACNPKLSPGILPGDEEFQKAVKTFINSETDKYTRLAAYEIMLRVDGAAFGTVLRDGYLSNDPAIVSAATFCEVMRANGAVAKVTGLPKNSGNLSDEDKAKILTYSFELSKVGEDWDQGCISNLQHPSKGCNRSYFTSARDGVVFFKHHKTTGTFQRIDGEFIGTIELSYGSPVYTVPAKLTLQ